MEQPRCSGQVSDDDGAIWECGHYALLGSLCEFHATDRNLGERIRELEAQAVKVIARHQEADEIPYRFGCSCGSPDYPCTDVRILRGEGT